MPNPTGKNQYTDVGKIYTNHVGTHISDKMKADLDAAISKRRQTNKQFKRADAIREALSMWLVMHGE